MCVCVCVCVCVFGCCCLLCFVCLLLFRGLFVLFLCVFVVLSAYATHILVAEGATEMKRYMLLGSILLEDGNVTDFICFSFTTGMPCYVIVTANDSTCSLCQHIHCYRMHVTSFTLH